MKRTITTLGVAAAFALGGLAVAGPASAAPMPHTSGNGVHKATTKAAETKARVRVAKVKPAGTVLGSSPLPGDHGITLPGTSSCHHIGWSKRCAPVTKPKCPVADKCRPAPLPKPANGWPCAKTKTCDTKHHYPVCPPIKPPVVTPPSTVTPLPPVIDGPKHKPAARVRIVPAARVRLVSATKPAPELAMTGVSGSTYFAGGLGLALTGIGVGLVALTRRPAEVEHDVRSVL